MKIQRKQIEGEDEVTLGLRAEVQRLQAEAMDLLRERVRSLEDGTTRMVGYTERLFGIVESQLAAEKAWRDDERVDREHDHKRRGQIIDYLTPLIPPLMNRFLTQMNPEPPSIIKKKHYATTPGAVSSADFATASLAHQVFGSISHEQLERIFPIVSPKEGGLIINLRSGLTDPGATMDWLHELMTSLDADKTGKLGDILTPTQVLGFTEIFRSIDTGAANKDVGAKN